MKKSISFTLIFTMLFSSCFTGQAFAAETAAYTDKATVTFQIGSSVMNVNGKENPVDESGSAPIVVNGSTVLPVKSFVEAVGGEYTQSGETVEITYGETEITINSVSGKAAVNAEETSLDTKPQTIEGRLYLPLRFTAENMGYSVIWTADSRTITVIDADTIENVFARGDLNPAAPYFTGVSYVNWLTSYDETMKIPAFGQVTFEPCTRTDWHTHDGGQILLVTEGVGVFEMEGEPARLMQAGDVILIPLGKRHFHSAINDSWFAHIALGVNPGAGSTNWFEKVTDDEYYAAVSTARENGTIREPGETMLPKGEVYTAEGYSGTVYKNNLVEYEDVFNCPEVNNYTLEAGARTAWHSHEGGQLIVVTNGTGIYQEEGGEARSIKAGDVIVAEPEVTHWHGAADSEFAYIAVNGNPGNDTITWGAEVSDDEYNSALNN